MFKIEQQRVSLKEMKKFILCKPKMTNAPKGLNQVILVIFFRKVRRFGSRISFLIKPKFCACFRFKTLQRPSVLMG